MQISKMLINSFILEMSSVHQEGPMKIYKSGKERSNKHLLYIRRPVWESTKAWIDISFPVDFIKAGKPVIYIYHYKYWFYQSISCERKQYELTKYVLWKVTFLAQMYTYKKSSWSTNIWNNVSVNPLILYKLCYCRQVDVTAVRPIIFYLIIPFPVIYTLPY